MSPKNIQEKLLSSVVDEALKVPQKKFLSFKKWEFADIIVISNEAADAAKDDDEEEDEAWRSKSAGENDSLSMSFDGTILVNFLLLL